MSTATASSVPGVEAAVAVRSGFFFWLSILMLALVLFGFAQTLYLRPYFDVEPIPGYLYVHGAVLTAWYVWVVVQTSTVRAGRIATHRQLGVIGAVIGAAVVVAAPMASFGVPGRIKAAGLDWNTNIGAEGTRLIESVASTLWGNLFSIAVFAGLVAAAILLRSDRETHKRLMILASIGNLLPALVRIAGYPGLGGEDGPLIPVMGLGLPLSVIVHDIVTRRRPHKAT